MGRIFFSLLGIFWLSLSGWAKAGPRVLYLGDSMSMGAFGTTLDTRLREAGLEVYTSVTGGATPYEWLEEFGPREADIGHWRKTPKEEARLKYLAKTPKLETLLATIKPDAVIVQTGANLYSELRSKITTPERAQLKVLSLMQKMATAVTSRGCALYWISPPSSHPNRFDPALQTLMLSLTKRAAAPVGRVFDSYAVTKFTDPYPETDGIHYGPTEAAAWAELVARDAIPYLKNPPPPRPRTPEPAAETKRPPKARIIRDDDPPPPDSKSLTAEIRLVRKSEFTAPGEIPYRHAIALYEWEILRIIEGNHASKRIQVAHIVVKNRKITSERDLKIGKTYIVQLVPLDTYPVVASFHLIDTINPPTGNLETEYIPKMD